MFILELFCNVPEFWKKVHEISGLRGGGGGATGIQNFFSILEMEANTGSFMNVNRNSCGNQILQL